MYIAVNNAFNLLGRTAIVAASLWVVQTATIKIKAAYGEKFDSKILFDSKWDVAEMLGEEPEVQSIREQLQKKPEPNAEHAEQKKSAKKHEQER